MKVFLVTEFGSSEIMDSSNGHDEKLVKLINKFYSTNIRSFRLIMSALINRDYDELLDACPSIESFKNEDDIFYEYLMHVADDEDLKVIINFSRMRDEKGNYIFV